MANNALNFAEDAKAYLAEEQKIKERVLRDNWTAVADTPDDYAKRLDLSKATGIPIASLYADPKFAKQQERFVGMTSPGW